jgi:hypothetical protein
MKKSHTTSNRKPASTANLTLTGDGPQITCLRSLENTLDLTMRLSEQVFHSLTATALPIKKQRRQLSLAIITALALFAQPAMAAESPENDCVTEVAIAGAATCAAIGAGSLAIVAAPTVPLICIGTMVAFIAIDIYSTVTK